MITPLIRTHGRPRQFAKCLASAMFENLLSVVSCDRAEDIAYASGYAVDKIIFIEQSDSPFGYNLYCNELLNHIGKGWGLFLDDDDTIITGSINQLNLQPGKSYIVPFMRGNFEKPDLARRKQKIIQSGYIGLPCLILWHEHKKYINFEATEDADYRVIKHLSTCVNLEWLDIPVVRSEKRNYGKMEK